MMTQLIRRLDRVLKLKKEEKRKNDADKKRPDNKDVPQRKT